jgi:hypothetical protein
MNNDNESILNVKLREVLFLQLASQTAEVIGKKMHCCPRTVGNYNTELMQLFFRKPDTDMFEICEIARSLPGLCTDLANEFRHRYPKLAPKVEPYTHARYERKEVNGKMESFIHQV